MLYPNSGHRGPKEHVSCVASSVTMQSFIFGNYETSTIYHLESDLPNRFHYMSNMLKSTLPDFFHLLEEVVIKEFRQRAIQVTVLSHHLLGCLVQLLLTRLLGLL